MTTYVSPFTEDTEEPTARGTRIKWAWQHAAAIDALIQARPSDLTKPGQSNVSLYRCVFLLDGELVSALLGVAPGEQTWVQCQRRASQYGLFSSQQLRSQDMHGIDVVAFLGLDTVDPDAVTWQKEKTPNVGIAIVRDPTALMRNGN